ncbi:hypothetical protein [Candidatus Babela massiliensis]|uniref:Uncharacterized protein n=1 Tax=Candidatus Babela massiliensis TaxID=673862 RepID=V6DIE3_9BACT|nr:hypothetical protein [Candidatus Babela massiliensis]CDK30698.1 hypothetical protein BABL1_gene_316 [Candidatus Babela massiliensis]
MNKYLILIVLLFTYVNISSMEFSKPINEENSYINQKSLEEYDYSVKEINSRIIPSRLKELLLNSGRHYTLLHLSKFLNILDQIDQNFKTTESNYLKNLISIYLIKEQFLVDPVFEILFNTIYHLPIYNEIKEKLLSLFETDKNYIEKFLNDKLYRNNDQLSSYDFYKLGVINFNKNDLEKSEKYHLKAFELGNFQSALCLSEIYLKQGRSSLSSQYKQKALDKKYLPAYLVEIDSIFNIISQSDGNKSILLKKLERYAQILLKSFYKPIAYEILGNIFFQFKNDIDQSINCYVFSEKEGNVYINMILHDLYNVKGDIKKSKSALMKIPKEFRIS